MIDPIVHLLLIIRSSHISASAFSKQEILISCYIYIYIYPGQLASPSSIPAGAYEFVLFVSAPIPIPILSVVADPPSPSHSELFSPPTPPPPDRD
jgi:hypothetical protein